MDYINMTNDINATATPSELSKSSPELLIFAAVVTGLIMLVGLSGNLLTVVALLKCPKVRNVAAAFIISLCIADFLFCMLVLPFAISGFWHRTWLYGDALCKMVPFIRYGNVGVSLLSIALITVNRYIMIAHHSWYARIYKKLNIACMIVFSWMFAYGMQIPTLVGVWGKFAYDPELGTCSIMPDENGNSSKTALFIIAFIVPAMLIVICYARIFWVVHSSEQRMREHQRSQHTTSPGTLNITEKRSTIKDQRETKARRNEWRITKMVLAIFLSFLVCYLPITIAKVADSHVHFPTLHIVGYLLLYASACVNPIIYVIMNAQYRAAYAAALCCPLARFSGLTSEMERASGIQLQQHKNGVKSSVTRGIESRPAGVVRASRVQIGKSCSGAPSIGAKSCGSLQLIGSGSQPSIAITGSRNKIEPKDVERINEEKEKTTDTTKSKISQLTDTFKHKAQKFKFSSYGPKKDIV